MFVKSIEYDSIAGEETLENPSWHIVESEIRALNGCQKDSLVLLARDQSYMGISGGQNDQYIVAGYLEGHGSFIATNGTDHTDPVEIAVCGDFNEYAASNILGLAAVVEVARLFFERGELNRKFTWERERRQAVRKT